MKKGTAILLLLIYTLTTFGISVRQVCFCKKLNMVAVTASHNHKCAGIKKLNGCCQSSFRFIKNQDNYLIPETTLEQVKAPQPVYIPVQPFLYAATVMVVNNAITLQPHNGLPLYIFNCIFRI